MTDPYQGLAPEPLWRYFDMVSKIPRGSGNETAVLRAITEVADKRKLEVRRDAVGNITIVVPAAEGCEGWPTVVLQGHVDMVCEKNSDVDHDFEKDPINVVRDGDWLTSRGTTLGADNGIAVAAALAMLDDPPPKHGKLELFFTVDEETGLTGAACVEEHMLTGKILLNLDSEEEGFVTVGCAGGGDTTFFMRGIRERAPADWQRSSISVRGLVGGHSGMDIIHNRANSLRVIGRLLDRVRAEVGGARLVSLDGGSMRNAIPREAHVELVLPGGKIDSAKEICKGVEAELRTEFESTDPNMKVTVEESSGDADPFDESFTANNIALLLATPSGVIAMSREIVGLPETSNNLGVVTTDGDLLRYVSCARSPLSSSRDAIREGMRAMAEGLGAEVHLENGYPGWKPSLDSKVLALFKAVHKEQLGKEPEVVAIHAGLECGILGERFPGLDMISFGPDIEGPHAPGERVNVPSTERFYALLKGLLQRLD